MKVCFYGNWSVDYTSESHHAASLEDLGHQVTRIQEPKATERELKDALVESDLFVWIHTHGWNTPGMEEVLRYATTLGVPTMAYHLDAFLQIPDRWDKYRNHPTMTMLDHYFTVDQCLADYLNGNTSVKGHYLPPGVFGRECYAAEPDDPFDVCFVGSKGYHDSYPMRPRLVQWLHDTYGDRFRHYGGGGRGTVRGAELNQVYANARVVVGDSYITDPNYPGKYWSDRVTETLGRAGGPLITPWVYGLDQFFIDGEHLVTYRHGDFDHLKSLIDYYLDHPDEAQRIRKAGHGHVKAWHTYKNRWSQILETVFGSYGYEPVEAA